MNFFTVFFFLKLFIHSKWVCMCVSGISKCMHYNSDPYNLSFLVLISSCCLTQIWKDWGEKKNNFKFSLSTASGLKLFFFICKNLFWKATQSFYELILGNYSMGNECKQLHLQILCKIKDCLHLLLVIFFCSFNLDLCFYFHIPILHIHWICITCLNHLYNSVYGHFCIGMIL